MILESKGRSLVLVLCVCNKSYLLMYILFVLGVPRLNTPPPVSSKLLTESQEKKIAVPKPIRVLTDRVANLDEFTQPWTRSPPKKFDLEHSLRKWQFIPGFQLVELVSSRWSTNSSFFFVQYLRIISDLFSDSSSRSNIQLAALPDSYDLDRGLLLSVQAIQVKVPHIYFCGSTHTQF